MVKICSKCKRELDFSCFNKQSGRKHGLKSQCKECCREYYVNNKVEILDQKKVYYVDNRDVILDDRREYYVTNKEEIGKRNKENYIKNRETRLVDAKEYRGNNKDKIRVCQNKYNKNKLETDPEFRLYKNMLSRFGMALKKNTKSGRTIELLGCSIASLKLHLQSKFYNRADDTPMTWENRGKKGWHIDHIRPCSSFDLSDPEQQFICFSWKNLQPLWAEDNLAKGGKWEG